MTITTRNVERIVEEVRRFVAAMEEKKHLGLRLGEPEYRFEDGWLYVCVISTKQRIHACEFAGTLSNIEQQLHKAGFGHVLLMPMLDE